MNDLLQALNPAQRAAVEHLDGPLLVLAGPGSGKTRVVTHRIAWLLQQGVRPGQILALTFTNKAAEEMRQRVERLAPGQRVWIGTFHRCCSRLLREFAPYVGLPAHFSICDADDSQRLIKDVLADLQLAELGVTPQQVAAAISQAKTLLLRPEEYAAAASNPAARVAQQVYPPYQARLRACGLVDFDDLLMDVALLLREQPEIRAQLDARFKYVLVDEYQDTNLAQYAIVRGLSIDAPNLAVTGDPDQAIYGWRGANLRNILEFEADYPDVRVVRLEQNYRSTQRILRTADALIQKNKRRKAKTLFTDNDAGEPVRVSVFPQGEDEARAIAEQIASEAAAGRRRLGEYAIFYRVNALSRGFEAALREHALAYQIVNGVEFFQRKEVKDLLAYLQLLQNPRHDPAFLRICNVPKRNLGKTSIQHLQAHAARYGLSLLEAARESGLIESISKRAAVGIAKFAALLDRLATLVHEPVETILGHVLEATEYRAQFAQSEAEEDQDRLANIDELLTAARQFDERNAGENRLEQFLENACLVNETDNLSAADRVTLMTLHASKGLEFPVVYLTALEEGLLPHERCRERPDELEEERRLLFVGITRARQELRLSLAEQRDFRGQRQRRPMSSFLLELPQDELEVQSFSGAVTPRDWRPAPEFNAWLQGEQRRREPARSPVFAGAQLATAADLLRQSEGRTGSLPTAPKLSPDDYVRGMVVKHPQYGLGRIIALGGQGASRKAVVQFFQSTDKMTFVLAYSPLAPVRSE